MELKVTEPCTESWDDMEPRPGGRFCQKCDHVVVDLEGLSRAQVEARVGRRRADYVCVRMPVDEAGEAVFRPSPSAARRAVGGLVLVSALTAGGCATGEPESAVITEVEEAPTSDAPCALPPADGPPMMPVELAIASPETLGTTGPVDADVPLGSGAPTAEQARLTAAKHRPAPVHHVMGRMPIHRTSF